MCIGFSEYHNAVQMNQIANFGSERGNFMYVPTQHGDSEQKITEALGESFDIALGSNSAIKFKIGQETAKYEIICPAEINYTAILQ